MSKNSLCLKKLSIKNFATFKSEVINFDKGFNIITGETGSGKSLIFDAIQLVLGGRSDKSLIRSGSEFLCIEVFFDLHDKKILRYFEEQGYPSENEEAVLKRIVYANGKSKSFLNYQQCKLSTLQSFSHLFIDLVGQFENQRLLSNKYQLNLVDKYANILSDVDLYEGYFSQYKKLQIKITSIQQSEPQLRQQLDFLSYQLKEIENLDPSIEKENDLKTQKEFLLKSNTYKAVLTEIDNTLNSSSHSIISSIHMVIKKVKDNPELFSSINTEALDQAKSIVEDFSFEVSSISLDDDSEASLESIVDKLDIYQKLKRKFGGTLQNVLESTTKLKNEKNEIENDLDNLNSYIEELNSKFEKLSTLALDLHQSRKKSGLILSKNLTLLIRKLNMSGATIDIKLDVDKELGPKGITNLEFYAQTNPGEGYYPISQIASGGELSRILLAIRQVFSDKDTVSVFFFDEIDTGIGGETALVIGKSLKKVSKNSQVIAITHLPQIAIHADKIIKVDKKIRKSKSETRTQSIVQEISSNAEIKDAAIAMNPLLN